MEKIKRQKQKNMPYRAVIQSFGTLIDGSLVICAASVVGANFVGVQLDASALMLAASGLMIAFGRMCIYLANAYKIIKQIDND